MRNVLRLDVPAASDIFSLHCMRTVQQSSKSYQSKPQVLRGAVQSSRNGPTNLLVVYGTLIIVRHWSCSYNVIHPAAVCLCRLEIKGTWKAIAAAGLGDVQPLLQCFASCDANLDSQALLLMALQQANGDVVDHVSRQPAALRMLNEWLLDHLRSSADEHLAMAILKLLHRLPVSSENLKASGLAATLRRRGVEHSSKEVRRQVVAVMQWWMRRAEGAPGGNMVVAPNTAAMRLAAAGISIGTAGTAAARPSMQKLLGMMNGGGGVPSSAPGPSAPSRPIAPRAQGTTAAARAAAPSVDDAWLALPDEQLTPEQRRVKEGLAEMEAAVKAAEAQVGGHMLTILITVR